LILGGKEASAVLRTGTRNWFCKG